MNGYCEFHSFERAVDVCNVCYGDVCRSCVVMLAGRRHATCKECVIDLSGVRTLARPVERGDKSTVKARRQQYASTEEDEYFQFFDSGVEADWDSEGEPAPERRRSRFRLGRNRSSTKDHDVAAADPMSTEGEGVRSPDPVDHGDLDQPKPAKAVNRLDRLRRSLHHGGSEDLDRPPVEPPATNAVEDVGDRSDVVEDLPHPAEAGSIAVAPVEPWTESEDEPTAGLPPLPSTAHQVPTVRPPSIDQPLEPVTLDSANRPEAGEESERFEPADLSVDPFEMAESRSFEMAESRSFEMAESPSFEMAENRSFEAPVLRYRPEPVSPTGPTGPPVPPRPRPEPPTPDGRAGAPPKPTPPADPGPPPQTARPAPTGDTPAPLRPQPRPTPPTDAPAPPRPRPRPTPPTGDLPAPPRPQPAPVADAPAPPRPPTPPTGHPPVPPQPPRPAPTGDIPAPLRPQPRPTPPTDAPAPPPDDTDAEGRWIPPALRGISGDD